MIKAPPHIERHKDDSIWAKGQMINGVPTGYWEWFRREGTKSRSGYFENGEPVGEWVTYDRQGEIYKITKKRPKSEGSNECEF